MLKKLPIVALAVIAMALLVPTDAQAQATTEAEANCTDCYVCNWLFPDDHDAPGPLGGWGGIHPGICLGPLTDCSGHPRCDVVGDASQEMLERDGRLKRILNTMEGEERIAALVNEFPSRAQVTYGALEVEGMLCEEGELIGRLTLTEEQVARYSGRTRLAAN